MSDQAPAPRAAVAAATPAPARRAFGTWTMPLVLLGLCVLFTILRPRFASATNLFNLLQESAVLGLAALAQTVVIIIGDIDLSTGSAVALVGVVTALVAKAAGNVAGFGAGLLLGMALGALNGLLVTKAGVPAFIATVGMYSYARGLAYFLGGGMPIDFPPSGFAILGGGHILGIPIPILIVAGAGVLLHLWLTRSVAGRYCFAVGGNRKAAHFSGIPVERVRLYAFALAGLLTGVTGVVLASRLQSGQPTVATALQFSAIAAVAIGGTTLGGGEGSVGRTILGTVIIGVLSNGLTLANVSTFVQDMIIGAVMVGAAAMDYRQRSRQGH